MPPLKNDIDIGMFIDIGKYLDKLLSARIRLKVSV